MMSQSLKCHGNRQHYIICCVQAREGSNKFHELRLASKLVTEATGAVVAVAKSSSVTAESKF